MKAFLLAAGLGTRLRPLTYDTPKCLLPINGKPLLSYWFDLFSKHGIDEVLINCHYQKQKIIQFINNSRVNQKVHISYEPVLLGSAGTVRHNRDFIKNDKEFFICYADNLTNINLSLMLDFHHKNSAIFTCGLFLPPDLRSCGVVSTNPDGLIINYEEKPESPKSKWANGGIFIATPEIIKFIPSKNPCDFGYDVLPALINRSYGFPLKDFLMDIGTIESYCKAQRDWPGIINLESEVKL